MSNVRVGDMAWYTCDYDFILNGQEQRTCEGNGTWSGPEPTCTPVGKYIPRDVLQKYISLKSLFVQRNFTQH